MSRSLDPRPGQSQCPDWVPLLGLLLSAEQVCSRKLMRGAPRNAALIRPLREQSVQSRVRTASHTQAWALLRVHILGAEWPLGCRAASPPQLSCQHTAQRSCTDPTTAPLRAPFLPVRTAEVPEGHLFTSAEDHSPWPNESRDVRLGRVEPSLGTAPVAGMPCRVRGQGPPLPAPYVGLAGLP